MFKQFRLRPKGDVPIEVILVKGTDGTPQPSITYINLVTHLRTLFVKMG